MWFVKSTLFAKQMALVVHRSSSEILNLNLNWCRSMYSFFQTYANTNGVNTSSLCNAEKVSSPDSVMLTRWSGTFRYSVTDWLKRMWTPPIATSQSDLWSWLQRLAKFDASMVSSLSTNAMMCPFASCKPRLRAEETPWLRVWIIVIVWFT